MTDSSEPRDSIAPGENRESIVPPGDSDSFYHQLRAEVRAWSKRQGKDKLGATGELVLLAPDFFKLLCTLLLDARVPGVAKAKLGIAVAYFVSPVDLIPEAIVGPIGYLDDVAVAAYALNSILDATTTPVVREVWSGKGDVIEAIARVLDGAKNIGISFDSIFGKKATPA
jgi:uncharacterized membrane protein YkvA (DUF1232 family)